MSCVAYYHRHSTIGTRKQKSTRGAVLQPCTPCVCRHQISMYTYTSFIMQVPGSAMFLARLAHSSHAFAKLAWVLPYIPACAHVLDGCRPHVMRVCSPAKPRAADAAAKICGAALPGALYKHGYTAPQALLSIPIADPMDSGRHRVRATSPESNTPSDTLAIGTRHPSPAP